MRFTVTFPPPSRCQAVRSAAEDGDLDEVTSLLDDYFESGDEDGEEGE